MFRRKPSHKNDLIATLDIGSTRVNCAIARVLDEDKTQTIGVGQHVAKGLKRGVIVDMDALVSAVAEAVNSAEHEADETIRKVFVAVPASVISSNTHTLEIPLSSHPVRVEDMGHIWRHVQEVMQGRGQEVLHAVPLTYELDDQKGILDPKGMYGSTLKAHLHVMAAPSNVLRNFMACLSAAHLDVAAFVAAPHASALATLVPDEMDLGAVLIDMGGGATSLITYVNNRATFVASVPLGGNHITQDISRVLSTPLAHGERIKALYGSAASLSSDERETLTVPQIGEGEGGHEMVVTKSQLNQIIQPRLEEILMLLKQKLAAHPESALLNRVILTGGASQLTGVRDFAAHILGKQVRLGQAQGMEGLYASPSFATCAGMVTYAAKEFADQFASKGVSEAPEGVWGRLKSLVNG